MSKKMSLISGVGCVAIEVTWHYLNVPRMHEKDIYTIEMPSCVKESLYKVDAFMWRKCRNNIAKSIAKKEFNNSSYKHRVIESIKVFN